jgi:hypothetical protein
MNDREFLKEMIGRNVVAFGTWRCNCTMLAEHIDDVPEQCPIHHVALLGPRTLELNPHRVPLGIWPDHRLTRAEGRSDGYG